MGQRKRVEDYSHNFAEEVSSADILEHSTVGDLVAGLAWLSQIAKNAVGLINHGMVGGSEHSL